MKNVGRNFIYNSLYQLLIILIPLITTPYLSRILGSEGIGRYSYSYSIAYYFSMFIILGLNNYGNRTIASVRDDKKELSKSFKSIYLMQFFLGLFITIIYFLYCDLFMNNIYAFTLGIYVASSIFDINWMFFGLEEFKITVVRNTIVKLITLVAIFVFIKDKNDVSMYCLIMALGFFISNLLLWPFLPKYIQKSKVTLHDVCVHIRPNLILFIPVIAISLYKTLDKIMLGSMTNVAEVGYFESSEKIINIPLALISSLGTVMLPRMSNIVAKSRDKKRIEEIIENSIILAMVVTVPLTFGIMGVAKEFVPLFYGNGFEKCISLFQILLPSCLFVAFANVIRTQYLIPNKLDNVYIISVILGSLVNILINYILIPKMGAIGAAFGTLIAEIVVCIIQSWYVRKIINTYIFFKKSVPLILFGIVMYAIIINIPLIDNNATITVILKVLIGALIYIIPCLLYILFIYKKKKVKNGVL